MSSANPDQVSSFLAEHAGLEGAALKEAVATLTAGGTLKEKPPEEVKLQPEAQERITADNMPTSKPLMGDTAWLDGFPKVLMEDCQPTDTEKVRFSQAMCLDKPFDQEVQLPNVAMRVRLRSTSQAVISKSMQWAAEQKGSTLQAIDRLQQASVACCLIGINDTDYELPGHDMDALARRVEMLADMQHIRWAWVLTAARVGFIKQRILADMVVRHSESFTRPAA